MYLSSSVQKVSSSFCSEREPETPRITSLLELLFLRRAELKSTIGVHIIPLGLTLPT